MTDEERRGHPGHLEVPLTSPVTRQGTTTSFGIALTMSAGDVGRRVLFAQIAAAGAKAAIHGEAVRGPKEALASERAHLGGDLVHVGPSAIDAKALGTDSPNVEPRLATAAKLVELCQNIVLVNWSTLSN